MKTLATAEAPVLDKVVLRQQFEWDVATEGGGWYISPSGLGASVWSMPVVYPSPSPVTPEALAAPAELPKVATARSPTPQPRTKLGRQLWELRQKIIESGEPLLTWSELELELAERRREAGE